MCLLMSVASTMSITILRNVCRCFFVRLTKISQSLFCRSLNATAQQSIEGFRCFLYLIWTCKVVVFQHWLIIVHQGQLRTCRSYARVPLTYQCGTFRNLFTCVDEKLICESGVVNVVDGRCKDCRHHLQRREHALRRNSTSTRGKFKWKILLGQKENWGVVGIGKVGLRKRKLWSILIKFH